MWYPSGRFGCKLRFCPLNRRIGPIRSPQNRFGGFIDWLTTPDVANVYDAAWRRPRPESGVLKEIRQIPLVST